MSTGLPMLNGMLSRIGVTDAAQAIQLAAHPLIEKEKVSQINSTKKILLVYGKNGPPLTVGEQYLLDHSEVLTDRENFQLRSLNLDSLQTRNYVSSFQTYFDTSRVKVVDHFHEGFEKTLSLENFAGGGCLKIGTDTTFLDAEVAFESDSLECSIFVKLDNRMYGNPQFFLDLLNTEGEILQSIKFNAYKSRDMQKGWVRAGKRFKITPETSRIKVKATEVNQNFLVDEFCIYPVNARVQTRKTNGDILYNNYLIRLTN
jgi:hypothetical protein